MERTITGTGLDPFEKLRDRGSAQVRARGSAPARPARLARSSAVDGRRSELLTRPIFGERFERAC